MAQFRQPEHLWKLLFNQSVAAYERWLLGRCAVKCAQLYSRVILCTAGAICSKALSALQVRVDKGFYTSGREWWISALYVQAMCNLEIILYRNERLDLYKYVSMYRNSIFKMAKDQVSSVKNGNGDRLQRAEKGNQRWATKTNFIETKSHHVVLSLADLILHMCHLCVPRIVL